MKRSQTLFVLLCLITTVMWVYYPFLCPSSAYLQLFTIVIIVITIITVAVFVFLLVTMRLLLLTFVCTVSF